MAKNGSEENQDRTGMVQQALSQQEILDRGEELAGLVKKREKLAEKKRTHNRKWNEELIQLDDAINELAEEVETGQAWVDAQIGLSFSGKPANGSVNGKNAAETRRILDESADAANRGLNGDGKKKRGRKPAASDGQAEAE